MKIKKPASLDVKKLYELELKAFKSESYSEIFFRQAIELFPDSFFIAEINNDLIGYCIGSSVTGHNERGWILSLAVDENYRGEGIGTKLLKKVITKLTIHGCHEIFLTVNPQNIKAKKIFETCGFKRKYEDKNYFGEKNPREIMILGIESGE